MDTSSYTEKNIIALKKFRQEFYSKEIELYTFRDIFENLSKKLGGDFSAVDLACGDGYYTREIRNYTKGDIFGVDFSKNYLGEAEIWEKKEPKNISYFFGDCFEDISESIFKGRKFDLVSISYLFNYAENDKILEKGIKNIRKLLKEGGIIVTIIHNVFYYYPEMYLHTQSLGVSAWPLDGNLKKEKFENGERINFFLHEPNNSKNLYSDPYENYYYVRETYEKCLEAAGFKEWEYVQLKVNPEFVEETEKFKEAIKYLGLFLIVKS